MIDRNADRPACFGKLEEVFPLGKDGLRHSPEFCMLCHCKTECLRSALAGPEGLRTRDEMTDKAYAAGAIGFWERWSRRKASHRKKMQQNRDGGHERRSGDDPATQGGRK
ncbi:MAG: hypothetical protein ACOZF0_06625 [Thermodesulfobacteriota bacterium]